MQCDGGVVRRRKRYLDRLHDIRDDHVLLGSAAASPIAAIFHEEHIHAAIVPRARVVQRIIDELSVAVEKTHESLRWS